MSPLKSLWIVLLLIFAILSVPCDAKESLEQIQKKADQGDIEAQFRLGNLYLNEVPTNLNEALKWFKKAAEKGHIEAQYMIGEIYSFGGRDFRANQVEAIKWYKQAAERGHAGAQVGLGFMYSYIQGLQNRTEAIKWFRLAAEQGNPRGQYQLAFMYSFGYVTGKIDYSEAIKWFTQAAEQGYDEAQTELGEIYYYGNQEIPQNYSESMKWYKRAAEQGDRLAQYLIGNMYASGEGTAKNDTEAMKWYKKAAEQGHKEAQRKMTDGKEGFLAGRDEKGIKFMLSKAQWPIAFRCNHWGGPKAGKFMFSIRRNKTKHIDAKLIFSDHTGYSGNLYREGLDWRFDWTDRVSNSNYTIKIKSDGAGYYYDWRMADDKGVMSVERSATCSN